MMTVTGPSGSTRTFPHQDEFARKFFGEAVRHLGDARLLHDHDRFPGAIASSQKAAELAVKAVLALDGSLGWWDKLQQIHNPMEEMTKHSHRVLSNHWFVLSSHKSSLPARVVALEKLSPSSPDKEGKFEEGKQVNAEYPFFYSLTAAPSRLAAPSTSAPFRFAAPSEFFDPAASEAHYTTAHELLTAYQNLYPQVQAWGDVLPSPL